MSLNCPYCDGKLKSGQARVHGTLGGFLIYGISHQNLYFKDESGKEIKILASGKSTPSMRCDQCGIVTLNLDHSDQFEKENLIELLTLCSSRELRASIQESNPELDVNLEIIKNWKKNYLPKDTDFRKLFTIDELSLLENFDKLTVDKNWIEIENLSEEIIEKLNKE